MTDKDTGGPAFPVKNSLGYVDPGMTLRDYFACKATDDDIARYQNFKDCVEDPFIMVPEFSREQARYKFADAMIEARK